jgi:hypothetical protein
MDGFILMFVSCAIYKLYITVVIVYKLLNSKFHKIYRSAVYFFTGTKERYINSLCHSADAPTIKYINGDKYFSIDGNLHREAGPAIEYINGLCHREGGPAVEHIDGDKEYYINGLRHREDGPAVEFNREKHWYFNGQQIHCKDNEEFIRIVNLIEFL